MKLKEKPETFLVTLVDGQEIKVSANYMHIQQGGSLVAGVIDTDSNERGVFSAATGYWKRFIMVVESGETEEPKGTPAEDRCGTELSGAHDPSGNISGGVDINRDNTPKKERILWKYQWGY